MIMVKRNEWLNLYISFTSISYLNKMHQNRRKEMHTVKRLSILFLPYVVAYTYLIFVWKVQTNEDFDMGMVLLIGTNSLLPYLFFIIPCYYSVRFAVEKWVKNNYVVWLMMSCSFVAVLHVLLVGFMGNYSIFNKQVLFIIWIPSLLISGTFTLLNVLFRYRTER